jgi:DNA-binding transcriptional ArsR family regulator
MDVLTLLLHPVRLRLVHALSGGQVRTTAELCASVPDVPKTTVYRHVGLLADAGVLEVAAEERVRGAVERHYRLRGEPPVIDDEAARAMTVDDHRRGFAAAMAALHAEFTTYLDRPGADPSADLIGYRQGVVWLDQAELREMLGEIRQVFAKRWANPPAAGREPRLMGLIQFPAGTPATRSDR